MAMHFFFLTPTLSALEVCQEEYCIRLEVGRSLVVVLRLMLQASCIPKYMHRKLKSSEIKCMFHALCLIARSFTLSAIPFSRGLLICLASRDSRQVRFTLQYDPDTISATRL